MLVLTRRVGESVLVGADVRVTVTECKGGRIKLGFEAPRRVAIVREELVAKGKGASDDRGRDAGKDPGAGMAV
jgi:carbon storage regulator